MGTDLGTLGAVLSVRKRGNGVPRLVEKRGHGLPRLAKSGKGRDQGIGVRGQGTGIRKSGLDGFGATEWGLAEPVRELQDIQFNGSVSVRHPELRSWMGEALGVDSANSDSWRTN